MKKVEAYMADCSRDLFRTEQDARRYEFTNLMYQMLGQMGTIDNSNPVIAKICQNLVGGVYTSSGDTFIEAARYFEEHRDMLVRGKHD